MVNGCNSRPSVQTLLMSDASLMVMSGLGMPPISRASTVSDKGKFGMVVSCCVRGGCVCGDGGVQVKTIAQLCSYEYLEEYIYRSRRYKCVRVISKNLKDKSLFSQRASRVSQRARRQDLVQAEMLNQQWAGVASSANGMRFAAVDGDNGHIYTSIDAGASWAQVAFQQNWSESPLQQTARG